MILVSTMKETPVGDPEIWGLCGDAESPGGRSVVKFPSLVLVVLSVIIRWLRIAENDVDFGGGYRGERAVSSSSSGAVL